MVETIFAIATGPGKSGVAVLRCSGPQSWEALRALTPGQPLPRPRRSVLRLLSDPATGEMIDRALVTGFQGPSSYTGEDCVEYSLHGSLAVIQSMISALSGIKSLRPAEPGEFTRRAFENGKMDLTAAEAVADLIAAETQAQKRQAFAQMEGALARLYLGWADRLTHILAHSEALIDFADDEVPESEIQKLYPEIKTLRTEIESHLADNHRGERLRHGVRVAVIGAPNAGKSSLVNCLARRDVAIVSAAAGTTRDVLETHLDLRGLPVILSDTAGLRPELIESGAAQDEIENEGMRRALRCAQEADLRILVFDGTLARADPKTASLITPGSLIVVNKKDSFHVEHPFPGLKKSGCPVIEISIKRQEGLEDFITQLAAAVEKLIGGGETPALTHSRYRRLLSDCMDHLGAAGREGQATEITSESLRLALDDLGRITGRVGVEDLLDIIFRDFCIGK